MALISDKLVLRGKPKESAWHISLLTPVLEYSENPDCSYSLKRTMLLKLRSLCVRVEEVTT